MEFKKKLFLMMYNEEVKIMYWNFNIIYRYFRFFVMFLFLYIGERMKFCFVDMNFIVGFVGGFLWCKKINLISMFM